MRNDVSYSRMSCTVLDPFDIGLYVVCIVLTEKSKHHQDDLEGE